MAQQLIADFCQLLNIPYQQQHGLFSANYYAGILPDRPSDKPELLVDAEGADTIGDSADSTPPHALQMPQSIREPTVEEAFVPFLEQEPPDYEVHQQLEGLEGFETEQQVAPLQRRPRHHRPAGPRAPT